MVTSSVVDDSFECFVLSGLGESWAGAAAVRNDGEPGWGGFGFDGPFEEALGDAPGCRPFWLPFVEVGLLQLGQFDVVAGEPGQQADGDGDFLFGAQEGAAGDSVHLVHSSLVVLADVAADHVKVLRVLHAFDGFCRPAVVAHPQFVALGERPGGRYLCPITVPVIAISASRQGGILLLHLGAYVTAGHFECDDLI
jgi:hypothetical protein